MALNGTTISKEGLEYLCRLINKIVSSPKDLLDDINLATNTTFSSVRIDSLIADTLQQANTHAEALCNALIKLTCEKTTTQPTLSNSEKNVIYLYSSDGNAPFHQYLKISDTELIDMGSTSISLNDYLTITDAVATYCKKTDFDALKTEVTNLKTKVGTDTLNTTSQDLSGGVNELKTDLTTHTSDTNIHVTTSDKTKWNKVDNKVDKNTSIKLKPLSNGSYCVINSYIANNNEFISLDIKKSDGTINRLELTNEGNVLNHINYDGSKWIRIGRFCTTNVADVEPKTINPTFPSTVTLGSSQRVIYSIKNGWANVSTVMQFSSPKLSWTVIATGLPKPDKTVNTSTVGETFVNANVAYRIKTDGTLEMRIDSEITQLNWWNINVSYPVAES